LKFVLGDGLSSS